MYIYSKKSKKKQYTSEFLDQLKQCSKKRKEKRNNILVNFQDQLKQSSIYEGKRKSYVSICTSCVIKQDYWLVITTHEAEIINDFQILDTNYYWMILTSVFNTKTLSENNNS